MKTILIVDKVSLQVQSRYQAQQSKQESYGGPWGSPEATVHLEVPEGLDADCVSISLVGDEYVVEQDANKTEAKLQLSRQMKLEEIRKLRGPKLSRVDQLVNIAVLYSWTAADKTELKNYRKALLDITEPYKEDPFLLDDLNPASIAWPTEPTEA